ncbi:aryl-sulfate sulfotransferase [Halopenitus sp. H-Gu1]|uniref:aryl-sulfate sulfotransferase n=1 Tax=Halopenitus sp. H-Gu1 TaxID=3242697 RepID=UPI00359E5727
MDRSARGIGLVVMGVVVLAATLGVGAATAPTIGNVDSSSSIQTLVGSQGGDGGYQTDGNVFLLDGDNRSWNEASADSYFDVTMREDGTVLAGFMQTGYEDGCAPYPAPCAKTGFRIIDPTTEGGPTVVDEYAFPVRTKTDSEVHDVVELSTGEFLVADMEHERLFVVENGRRTWTWTASSFYDPPEDPTRRDWLHINDVVVIDDDRYLISVRNANQLLIIEQDRGVVEVINEDDDESDESCLVLDSELIDSDGDGDVRCGDPTVLNHQHNPQWLDDGAVLVADSGNDRAVELHRNETTGEWKSVWTLENAEGLDLRWPRDADRLENGNTLVTDTRNARLLEVTENGTVVWSHRTSGIPYEAERLPDGELVGAPRYGGDNDVNPERDVPLLSVGLVVLRSIYPATPYWFGEIHLGGVLVSVALVAVGSSDWYWD